MLKLAVNRSGRKHLFRRYTNVYLLRIQSARFETGKHIVHTDSSTQTHSLAYDPFYKQKVLPTSSRTEYNGVCEHYLISKVMMESLGKLISTVPSLATLKSLKF